MADTTGKSNPQRIYQQIESSADTWDPFVYDLLKFNQAHIEFQGDPLTAQKPLCVTETMLVSLSCYDTECVHIH